MGCSSSATSQNTSNTNRTPEQAWNNIKVAGQSSLTEEEKQIVQTTWTYMTKDISGNGLQVFLKIFELCPDTKQLLHVQNVRHSELARNPVIKSHGTRFMNAIGGAIICLNESEGNQEKLGQFLFDLGQLHKRYSGFKSEYFEIFYEALMWRWKLCIGDKFTPEVSDTWRHVFTYMLEKLEEGYFSQ